MYDLIIIGAGPAGISASLYAKRANLNVMVLYYGKSSLEKASKIDNYYGFIDGIDAKKLYQDGIKQAENLGVKVKNIEVLGVQNLDENYIVKTEKESFETKAIILATGSKKIKPEIKGIDEFEGKGISYCAICDAFFYKNKNVAIIGNGKFAINEAEELSHIANSVTILTNGLEKPECKYNVKQEKIQEIIGENKVNSIKFEDGSILDIDGIFIALGEAGASDFAKTLGIFQDGDSIKVNENMETNIKGIYACGDITGGLLQVCKASYEGATAALSAINYIRKGE